MDRRAGFLFPFDEIPIEGHLNGRQHRSGFAEIGIDLQSLHCSRFCLRECVSRRHMAVETQRNITFCKAGIGQRVSWIAFDRFAEISNSALETLRGPLGPLESALQVKVVRRDILCISPCQKTLSFRAQFQPQFFRDLARNLLFDREDIRRLAAILIPTTANRCRHRPVQH